MRVPLLLGLMLGVSCGSARGPDANQASPGLVFPAEFAEGKGDGDESEPARAQPAPAASSAAPSPAGSQPDPEPLRQAEQYEYEVVHERGSLRVERVRPVTYPQPVVTARRMGRYAIELWIGHELVERVRFDFPLTAADEPPTKGPQPLNAPVNLGSGVTARQKVLVPAAERARQARLVDRATGASKDLPWPPDQASKPPVPRAVSSSAAPP